MSAPAPAVGTSGQPPPANEMLSEKEAKEKALAERLEKKGAMMAVIMRRFVANFHTGRQQMVDAARAAEAAKRARGGKKGKKKKKAEPDKKKDKAGDKKKAKPKNPVQQAWATFLDDLDERINKAKRCGLPDMYRGVHQLQPAEQRSLAAIIQSTNKKILPISGMNANQLNIKEALYASAAAFDYPVDRVTLSSNTGLKLLKERGASVEQCLQHGYSEGALVRNGLNRGEIIAASAHSPRMLHAAGLQISELVECGVPAAANNWRGYRALRASGYAAGDMVQGGLTHAWNLERAGFPIQDLLDAGLTGEQLFRDGIGLPGCPTPLEPLSSSMFSICQSGIDTLPPYVGGTQGSTMWRALVSKPPQTSEVEKKPLTKST